MTTFPKKKILLLSLFLFGLVVATLVSVEKETSWLESYKDATNTLITKVIQPIKNLGILPETKPRSLYIEIIDSCGPYFEGACVRVRSGPGTEYKTITKLRNGVVLKVGEKVTKDGATWYKITFNEWLRYEDRVTGDWYVSSDYSRPFLDEGLEELASGDKVVSTKRILVDRSDQKLYAYNGKKLFMEESISTGIELSPTPRGVFKVFKKTPSRYMQGPLPGISEKYYDLPGVPWNLYFTEQGAVIHGAYWHDKFGKPWSSGCVNLPVDKAKELYEWADIGMEVTVRD